ncbi:hypothetical protein [Candidatus Bodocaedibacter vickermanii]|uniref:Uncharacterized protein n=1 Tax=Candidatus Bodocaedibacter vickermanii TaxID=2741701 RepID=A0A7L9RUI9_9PROT|nr:hypothetical protein CPBP_01009 [Candidatus Paracaedibacteraceae bacterium 'Lake Konstanz']
MLNLIRAIIIIGAGASQQTHAVYSGGVENQGVQIALQEFAAANANLADKPISRATHTTPISRTILGGSIQEQYGGSITAGNSTLSRYPTIAGNSNASGNSTLSRYPTIAGNSIAPGNLNTLNGDDISSINVTIELIELYRQRSLLANKPTLRW